MSYRLRNTACTAKDTTAVATATAAVIFAVVKSSSFVGFAFVAISNVFATAGTNTSLRKGFCIHIYFLQYRLFLLG